MSDDPTATRTAISKLVDTSGLYGRIWTKGLLLAAWLAILLFLAGFAATGQAAKYFTAYFLAREAGSFDNARFVVRGQQRLLTGREYLGQFVAGRENPPPIGALLDTAVPNWRDVDLGPVYNSRGNDMVDQKIWVEDQYTNLFGRADDLLKGYAALTDEDARAKPLRQADMTPDVFRTTPSQKFDDYMMPAIAVAWIEGERQRIKEGKDRYSLVDTFILLSVLGAFGSLIFLTHDFVVAESETNMSAYLFRPVLGILLAVAVFIVDVLAHTAISTANIQQLRPETLYLLALAAGLLSERAYQFLNERARGALGRVDRNGQAGASGEREPQPQGGPAQPG